MIKIDGQAYSCESLGWQAHQDSELRILNDAIRARYDIDPPEALCVTVPWRGTSGAEMKIA